MIEGNDSIASQVSAGLGTSARTQRQSRSKREANCQMAMLGAVMAVPRLLEGIESADFSDAGIAGVVDLLKSFNADRKKTLELDQAKQWIADNVGVQSQEGEAIGDALTRTLRENALRRRAADLLQRLGLQSMNHSIPDADFIRRVKEEVEKL